MTKGKHKWCFNILLFFAVPYILVIIVFIFFLALCIATNFDTYDFPNRESKIESIILYRNHNEEVSNVTSSVDPQYFSVIRILKDDEFDGFMSEIMKLKTKGNGNPAKVGYGKYFAMVTYLNGNTEIFSSRIIEIIEKGCEPSGVGDYYFSDSGFMKVFTKYSNKEDLGRQ